MLKHISLPDDVEKKLSEYRKQRREETGKLPFRETAIAELLRKALTGVEPEKTLSDRISDLEHRISKIESSQD